MSGTGLLERMVSKENETAAEEEFRFDDLAADARLRELMEETADSDREESVSAEELEHRSRMSATWDALISGKTEREAPVGVYEYAQPAHAEPVASSAPRAEYLSYAPASPKATVYAPAAPALDSGDLFKSTLRRETYAPAPEAEVDAQVYEPAPAYDVNEQFAQYDLSAYSAEGEGEDARPTARTMQTKGVAVSAETGFMAALSARTKIVLATVAAFVVLLLAVVCVNSAVLRSINADVAERETRLSRLQQEKESIDEEISRVTDPEYVEQWAIEHGMTK